MMQTHNPHKILFERPNLAELTQHYTVVDPHFHSHYSDGNNSVNAIVERARELNIGIAITDHNDIRGALELDRYKGFVNIPGIEVTSKEGTHMGHDIMSSTKLKMEEIIVRARTYETVIIFPHPYSATFTGIHNSYFSEERLARLFTMVDGIEVINAENLNKWNLRSALLGFNLAVGITGGSDGHRLAQMGKVVCYADCKNSRRAFLDAIKKNQTMVIGKEIDLIRKVTSNGVKLRTNIKNCPDLVEKNLKYSYTFINAKSKMIRDNVKRSLNDRFKEKRKKHTILYNRELAE
jgi:hypothetical protein